MKITRIEVRPRAKNDNAAALSVRVLGEKDRVGDALTIGVIIDAGSDEVSLGDGPGRVSKAVAEKAVFKAMSIASQFANADPEELKKRTVASEGRDDDWPFALAVLGRGHDDWSLEDGREDDWP